MTIIAVKAILTNGCLSLCECERGGSNNIFDSYTSPPLQDDNKLYVSIGFGKLDRLDISAPT